MVESYMVYIVMGVSGSGKSTFGKLLAKQKGIPFIDADDVHPPENIRKMGEGIPLDDRDRQPWLERLAEILEEHEHDGVVLACSALKASYRTILIAKLSGTCLLVYLRGTYDTIHRMISQRSGHFFSPDMPQKPVCRPGGAGGCLHRRTGRCPSILGDRESCPLTLT